MGYKMTASSYLKNITENAVLGSTEKESITRSEVVLHQRLTAHFGSEVKEQFRFGSFDRGTILPRSMDKFSDVDYMIVFEDKGYKPQTYLDKLKRFVDEKYTRSEVSQSHPAIKLELNHICFELVPAIRNIWYLSIPKKDDTQQNWISTDPKDINAKLTEKNSNNKFLIKPLVRLVKYWNACNGYPYESFELEKEIIKYDFGYLSLLSYYDLKSYFFEFMMSRPELWEPQWKIDKIQRAKKIIEEVKRLEKIQYFALAEEEIKKLIPQVNIVTRKTLLG